MTANKTGKAVVAATPVLDTQAYLAGDMLANVALEFAEAVHSDTLSGVIQKMVVLDRAGQSAPLALWLFNDSITMSTGSNAAFLINDTDAAKCIGVIGTGPYASNGSNSVATTSNVNLPIYLTTTTLYAVAVATGAVTYGAAGALTFSLDIQRD